MKQTTIEWLIEQMNNIKGSSISMNGRVQFIEKELNNLLDQAKAMEKEQIIEFTNDYVLNQCYASFEGNVSAEMSAEEYYNLTLKK